MLRRGLASLSKAVVAAVAATAGVVLVVVLVLGSGGSHAPRPQPVGGLFSYDPGRPLNTKITANGTQDGVKVYNIGYDGFDGQRVPALMATPVEKSTSRGCLILQPELGGDKEEGRAL